MTSIRPIFSTALLIFVGLGAHAQSTSYPFIGPEAAVEVLEGWQGGAVSLSLPAAPTGVVVIQAEVEDPDELIITSATQLEFNTTNWSVPQKFGFRGVQDFIVDGPQITWLRLTVDTTRTTASEFIDADPHDTQVTVNDIDRADIHLTCPPGISCNAGDRRFTTEAGGTAEQYVKLQSRPSSTVQVTFFVSDPSEGALENPTLQFEPEDWDVSQQLIISGVDDDLSDGDKLFELDFEFSSSDPNFADATESSASLIFTNLDDEPGFAVQACTSQCSRAPSLFPLYISEGSSRVLYVLLTAQPTGDVIVALTTTTPAESFVTPAELVFTPSNWNEPQSMTIESVDDALADGDIELLLEITGASSDESYAERSLSLPIVSEDDEAGIQIGTCRFAPCVPWRSSPVLTSEDGTTVTRWIRLSQEPTAEVSVTVTSSDPTEGTLDQQIFTVSPSEWFAGQQLIVHGVDDTLADGDTTYIITATGASADPRFDGFVATATMTNLDDETSETNPDGDGVPDVVESMAPNGGDGNGDGVPDVEQPRVTSLESANGNGWITIVADCDLRNVHALEPDEISEASSGSFPFGLLAFELPCASASLEIIYHGGESWTGRETYRKYGPLTPGQPATATWYQLPGVVFDATTIDGSHVPRARFTLRDGALGDDTGFDGLIVDQGGPAIPLPSNIPTVSEWMLIMLAGLLAVAGIRRLGT